MRGQVDWFSFVFAGSRAIVGRFMSPEFQPPEICPVCGETVPRRATACPGCGADERTGWDEDATRYDGLDLPEEGTGRKQQKEGHPLFWMSVVVALLVILVLTLIFRR
jgi:predicted nucleic acid-binding Zn ribbon protein